MCAAGGPLSALCAVVAAAVSWAAIDQTLIKIDELQSRDAMRAEILATLHATKLQLAADLNAQQHAMIDQLANDVAASIDRAFVPARQGL
jgi:hypothetical protein